ncbi:MAG: anion permease [Gemmatimonadetes bacterium]|nr:anion permease [Gemmatimonadota bacterium]
MTAQRSAAPGRARVRLLPLLAAVLVGALIWKLPHPEAVEPRAWHLLAVFVATIVAIIARPLPVAAVALVGITVAVLSRTLSMAEALSGFGQSVVWLVVSAFFIASGFIRTGLGTRIAYHFMALLGKRSLGLSYGLVATDLVLAPAIPSNTARAGGVIFPILRSLGKTFGSEVEAGTARKISSFLTLTAYQGTVITSAMFLTAMAANPLAVQLAGRMNIQITWGLWALAAVVPGFLSLVAVPFLIYRLYPPEIRETPAAAAVARAELARMGPMKRSEWILAGVFILMLVLWIFGGALRVDSTAAAMAGVSILLLSGALTWDHLLAEREAWNTLVWFATLLMMAGFLNDFGLIPWFSDTVSRALSGMSWVPAFLGLSLTYFYAHYLFASNTAHVSAMYAPFLGVALAVGTPPLLAGLILAFFSNLYAGLTHYGTAPGPILYGSGNVPLGVWWGVGAAASVANIVIWLGVGGLWWKILGLW